MAEKIIIIGSGPAGLSAAVYAAREGFEPLVIAGSAGGGQLELTTVVENFPAFPEGIMGPELVSKMKTQAEKFGTRFVYDDLSDIDISSRPFKAVAGGRSYEAESIIIATGAKAKTLGIESENNFIGRGVSTCGTCDGPFFKNKNVIVVGGGDTAMEDANFITKFAESVTIVHRRNEFKASKIMQEKIFSNSKIKIMWDSEIIEILGAEKVNAVKLRNTKSGEITQMAIDGVFIAIGHSPNTEVFRGKFKLDEAGYLVTSEEVLTETEGIYVAGDVSDKVYRQAVTASASGVKCALRAREYLLDLNYRKEREGKN